MDDTRIFQKIMVFLPNWVGDVVMATPALRSLRERFADSSIAYIGRKSAIDTLAGCAWADTLITRGRASGLAGVWNFLGTARSLRRQRPDLAILLPNSFRSALLASLGGCRRIVGYRRDGRGPLLSVAVEPPRDQMGYIPTPAIDYYNKLVQAVGAAATSRRMELPLTASDELAAEALLRQHNFDPARPLVTLNPGAAFGRSKLWHYTRYGQLADELVRRRGAQIVIHAAPSEKPIAEQVGLAMRETPLINFARRDSTLGLLKALLRRSRLLVTNDTGARHIGAAVGIGVVTVFGSTDPDWTTIYYDRERIVRVRVDCSPCRQPLCPQPAGPLYHQCMTAITVDMVLQPALELLDQPEATA